jgi:hypothetical protein
MPQHVYTLQAVDVPLVEGCCGTYKWDVRGRPDTEDSPQHPGTFRRERNLREAVATVERLQREAERASGQDRRAGRVFEIELWRARLQGVAATSRVGWMLAGGAVTGVVVAMINNS